MEDRDLVRQALDGDVRAYRRLIERYRNAVYGLAISFVGDFDLAEDMAQEAFILGYYRLSTLADWDRFGVWLRTITANLCRMELRRRRATPMEEEAFDADGVAGSAPAPDAVYEQDAVRRQVREALMGLSEKDRRTAILHYLEGLTIEELSHLLDVSRGAIKGRLHRARQHLRKIMSGILQTRNVRPASKRPKLERRFEMRQFTDFVNLNDEEIQKVFRQTNTKDLAIALKPEDPGLEKVRARCYENVSERVRGIIEEFQRTYTEVTEEVNACQEGILKIVHQLQEAGDIRASKKS